MLRPGVLIGLTAIRALTSPEMEAILGRIQDRPELRDYTAGQCRPVVSALVD